MALFVSLSGIVTFTFSDITITISVHRLPFWSSFIPFKVKLKQVLNLYNIHCPVDVNGSVSFVGQWYQLMLFYKDYLSICLLYLQFTFIGICSGNNCNLKKKIPSNHPLCSLSNFVIYHII